MLRAGPLLLGLFSVVALIAAPAARALGLAASAWYAKADVMFANAIACVRGLLWSQTVLPQVNQTSAF